MHSRGITSGGEKGVLNLIFSINHQTFKTIFNQIWLAIEYMRLTDADEIEIIALFPFSYITPGHVKLE